MHYMMKYTLLLTIFAFSLSLFAQYENSYPQGPIPDDFLFNTIEKTSQNLEKEDSTGLSRKSRKKFYLESNFVLNELLTSGLILFNEPISNYVRSVASEVLQDQPELLNELDFYVLRSSAINAFATNDGNIFITIGILSKLKTEGQLASVITHEIIHYVKKHSIKSYDYNLKVENEDKSIDKTNLNDKLLAKSLYSKAHELEADKLGLELFLKTGYSPNNIIGAFKALETYFLPYDFSNNGVFNYVDEDINLDIPTNIDSTVTYEISEKDTEYSTHPHISKRILIAGKLLEGISMEGVDFLQTKENFNEIQKQARFELCNELLFERQYIKALAVSNDLLDSYPEEPYLKSVIAKAWYGIYEYKKLGKYADIDLSEIPEIFQPYYKLINHNELSKIKELAISKNYSLIEGNPHHKMIYQQLIDSIPDLTGNSFDQDSVVFIDPFYFRIDLRKEQDHIRYIGSEQIRSTYATMILQNAEIIGSDLQVYSSLNLTPDQIDQFNHIGDLKRFFENSFANEELGTNILPNNYNELISLKNKGIRYVGLTGGFSFHTKKSSDQWTTLVMSALIWPTFPLGLINFLSPNFHSLNFILVYDIKTGKLVYEDSHLSQLRDTKGTINSMLYYNLLKMKNHEQ